MLYFIKLSFLPSISDAPTKTMNSLFSSSFTITPITKSKSRILAAVRKSPPPSPIVSAATTAIASAALFLSSIHSPALAAVSPIPTTTSSNTETLTDAEKKRIVEELYSSVETGNNSFSDFIDFLCLLVSYSKNEADYMALIDRLRGDIAKKKYEHLLKEDPSEGRNRRLKEVKMVMGQAWIIEGKHKDSRRIFEEIVKEETSDCRPYLCLGIVCTLLGKKDEAEKQFQNYRNLAPKRNRNVKYLDEDILAIKVLGKRDEIKRKKLLRVCFARIEHELKEGWLTCFFPLRNVRANS